MRESDGDEDNARARKQYLKRLGFLEDCDGIDETSSLSFPRCARALQSPPSVTLVLLDWDDTLFCTSALRRRNAPRPGDATLRQLEAVSRSLLTLCLSLGQTVIVTNAQGGWVQKCVDRFMPQLQAELTRVTVVSARDRFEKMYPDDPVAWKCATFAELKENSCQIANLVAIGDQEAEMKAVAHLALLYHTAFVKSVRLMEGPTVSELGAQLRLLGKRLPRITHTARHLSISLRPKSVRPESPERT